MYTLAVILHIIVCFLMIAAILLQSGKGAEIGAAFGGSSQTVFGSRGPGTFLSKVTVAAAIIFMLTSLGLAVLSKQSAFTSTVIDLEKTETPSSSPASAESKPAESKPAEPTAPEAKPADASTPAAAPAAPETK